MTATHSIEHEKTSSEMQEVEDGVHTLEHGQRIIDEEDIDVYTASMIKKGRLRLDIFLLGFLILMFIHLQFDRTNLGNALTDGFAKSIGIAQKQINLGQTLFTLAIVLFELPSNIVLKRIGAHIWLPLIMFIWGTITWIQLFLENRAGFYATRFLLAMGEAGFIPGAAYFLGRFYIRSEMGFRYALLWSANSIAGALSGVLALGLLELNGKGGLRGWQYLFLVEGVMTVFVALIAFFYLPADIIGASSWRFLSKRSNKFPAILTEEQAEIISKRVLEDDPTKIDATPSISIRWKDFDCFSSWKLPGHCAMAFLSSVMFQPINTYAPSIIKSLGYKGYTANGLNSVGSVCALFVSLSLAFSSDRRQERGLHITTGFFISAVGLLWLALASNSTAKSVLYGGVIVTQAGMGSIQGINAAWLSSKLEERQRPVALAAYAMSIQLAGFVGSNLFQAKDAPRYRKGLLICAGCVLGASALSIIYTVVYKLVETKEQRSDQGAEEKDGSVQK